MLTSAMPAAETTTDSADYQRILEDFVVGNVDLQQLEILLRKFNLFEALNLVWVEVRHSDFLAYLLNPQQNHGLQDSFLKTLLQSVLKGEVNQAVTPIDIDVWNLTSAEVYREWQNIDIFVRDESNHLAVLIENKVQSGEHSDQLVRYYECVARECTGWKIVPIYLSIESEKPSDERFIPLGYVQVCELVERLVELHGSTLDGDVRIVIEHYAEMLRRHLVTESEISELCRRIYAKHKQALDLIYEHRPDRQQMMRELLEGWISQDADLELDHCSKSYVRFIPKKIDTVILKQGQGWTRSGRILLFEVYTGEFPVILRVTIGPGPLETRRKLFHLAHAKQPPFKPTAKFYNQWNTILAHKLLTAKDSDLHDDDFKVELEKQWKRFVERELPAIVAAIDAESWIHDTNIAQE